AEGRRAIPVVRAVVARLQEIHAESGADKRMERPALPVVDEIPAYANFAHALQRVIVLLGLHPADAKAKAVALVEVVLQRSVDVDAGAETALPRSEDPDLHSESVCVGMRHTLSPGGRGQSEHQRENGGPQKMSFHVYQSLLTRSSVAS